MLLKLSQIKTISKQKKAFTKHIICFGLNPNPTASLDNMRFILKCIYFNAGAIQHKILITYTGDICMNRKLLLSNLISSFIYNPNLCHVIGDIRASIVLQYLMREGIENFERFECVKATGLMYGEVDIGFDILRSQKIISEKENKHVLDYTVLDKTLASRLYE